MPSRSSPALRAQAPAHPPTHAPATRGKPVFDEIAFDCRDRADEGGDIFTPLPLRCSWSCCLEDDCGGRAWAAAHEAQTDVMHHGALADGADGKVLHVIALDGSATVARNAGRYESEDRNAWREQAAKVVAALPSPIPALAPTPEARRSW
jgi:hypothetical protein